MFAAIFLASATALSCNTADTAIWDKTGKADFASDEKTCALRCGGQNPCTGDCMSSKYGYSHDCGQCFGALSSCVVGHCLGSGNCAIAPNGEACKSCTEQHCTPAFESCTGFKPSATKALRLPTPYWAHHAIPDGAVLCAGQPKENYCDCQGNGDCQPGDGLSEFCYCDEAKKCCAGGGTVPDSYSSSSSSSSDDSSVTCPGQSSENYCDCEGDCTYNPEFCGCDAAKKCCSGKDLGAPLVVCNAADTKIWDSTGKAHFGSDEKTCAMRCGGQNPCTGDCMSSKYGYSHACGQCFGSLSSCVVAHCLGSGNCAIGPNGEACKSCTNQHCTPAFESCTGWSSQRSVEKYAWLKSVE